MSLWNLLMAPSRAHIMSTLKLNLTIIQLLIVLSLVGPIDEAPVI